MAPRATSKRGRVTVEEAPSFDASRFKSADHEEWYHKVIKGKLINPERAFQLSTGEYDNITSELHRRKWTRLNSLIQSANQGLVRDFYANAFVAKGEEKTWKSFVRGKEVAFSDRSINALLRLNRHLYCRLDERRAVKEEDINYEEIVETLCRPGSKWKNWEPGQPGYPKRLRNTDLKPMAKSWCSFYHQNIESCSNTSEVIVSRALGVLCIVKGEDIDLGRHISNSIASIANDPNSQLGHASIIHELCLAAGCEERPDDLYTPPRQPITASWINKLISATPRSTARPPSLVPEPSEAPQASTRTWQDDYMLLCYCRDQEQGKGVPHLETGQFRAALRAFKQDLAVEEAARQQHQSDPLLNEDDIIED